MKFPQGNCKIDVRKSKIRFLRGGSCLRGLQKALGILHASMLAGAESVPATMLACISLTLLLAP